MLSRDKSETRITIEIEFWSESTKARKVGEVGRNHGIQVSRVKPNLPLLSVFSYQVLVLC